MTLRASGRIAEGVTAGFKRPWPPCGAKALGERRLTLIKMDAAVKAKVEERFGW